MPEPRYTDEEVKAIIERVIDRQRGGESAVTHDDLLGIGEQVGLSRAEVEAAAREVREARLSLETNRRISSSRKRWLLVHAVVFAVLNGLLFTVNALTTPGEWWVLFSVVFWGLALALHAGLAFGAGVSNKRRQRERVRIEAEQERDLGARTPVRVEEPDAATDEGGDVERSEKVRAPKL